MSRRFEGWVVKYGSFSRPFRLANGRLVSEVFESGAFADSLASLNRGEFSSECNIEHVQNNALMRLAHTEYNARVEHRSEGVYAVVSLLDDSISDDMYKRIIGGLIRGLSVQFKLYPGEEAAYEAVGGNYIRRIKRAQFAGFSITADPCYDDAKIVKVMDGDTTVFSRSVTVVELAQIEEEVKSMERKSSTAYYDALAFALGHGLRLSEVLTPEPAPSSTEARSMLATSGEAAPPMVNAGSGLPPAPIATAAPDALSCLAALNLTIASLQILSLNTFRVDSELLDETDEEDFEELEESIEDCIITCRAASDLVASDAEVAPAQCQLASNCCTTLAGMLLQLGVDYAGLRTAADTCLAGARACTSLASMEGRSFAAASAEDVGGKEVVGKEEEKMGADAAVEGKAEALPEGEGEGEAAPPPPPPVETPKKPGEELSSRAEQMSSRAKPPTPVLNMRGHRSAARAHAQAARQWEMDAEGTQDEVEQRTAFRRALSHHYAAASHYDQAAIGSPRTDRHLQLRGAAVCHREALTRLESRASWTEAEKDELATLKGKGDVNPYALVNSQK